MLSPKKSYNPNDIQSLVAPYIRNEKGRKMLYFKSGRLDYEEGYLYRGVTKSGQLKLGHIYSEGPSGIKFQNRLSRLDEYPKGSFFFKGGERGAETYLNVLRRK